MTSIRDKIEGVREHILKAAIRSGRKPEEIVLMAVTKNQTREIVEEAYAAGIRVFGENRVFEASEKYKGFPHDAELHLIGHLQRNKAKLAACVFSWVQSIDKVETAVVLNEARSGTPIQVLIQVNTSGESTKGGVVTQDDVYRLADAILTMRNLKLRGLMTIGPLTDEEALIRNSFARLYAMHEDLKQRYPAESIDTLSMGMSGDYELAVEEGSTLLRIGTALFGPRNMAR